MRRKTRLGGGTAMRRGARVLRSTGSDSSRLRRGTCLACLGRLPLGFLLRHVYAPVPVERSYTVVVPTVWAVKFSVTQVALSLEVPLRPPIIPPPLLPM